MTLANACTKRDKTMGMAARVMAAWSYLHADPEFRMWDAEAQGDMAVRVAHRLAVRAELTTRANVLRHFNLIVED